MNKMVKRGGGIILLVLLVGCGQLSSPSNGSSPNDSVVNTDLQEATSTTNQDTAFTDMQVSLADAIQIWERQYPEATLTSIHFEREMTGYYYQMSGVTADQEYEIAVQATTGVVREERSEQLDREDAGGIKKKNEALDLTKLIMPTEAMAIARAHTFASGVVEEWSIEQELGVTYYEIVVKEGFAEQEVLINSHTGDVIQLERD